MNLNMYNHLTLEGIKPHSFLPESSGDEASRRELKELRERYRDSEMRRSFPTLFRYDDAAEQPRDGLNRFLIGTAGIGIPLSANLAGIVTNDTTQFLLMIGGLAAIAHAVEPEFTYVTGKAGDALGTAVQHIQKYLMDSSH